MINNKEALMAARDEAKKQVASYKCRILVCAGTGCIATGSLKIYEELLGLTKNCPNVTIEFAPDAGKDRVGVIKTG